jgi:hypothetical protein
MEVRCAGCKEEVSEWAARCPYCGRSLDDAEVVSAPSAATDLTQGAPVRPRREAAEVAPPPLLPDPVAALQETGSRPAGRRFSKRIVVGALACISVTVVVAGLVALSRPGPAAKPSRGPAAEGKAASDHGAAHRQPATSVPASKRRFHIDPPTGKQLPAGLAAERLFFAEPVQTGFYQANGDVVTKFPRTRGAGDQPIVSGDGAVVYIHGRDAYRTSGENATHLVNLGGASWIFPAEHGAIGIESGGDGTPASVEFMAADGAIPEPGTTKVELPPDVTAIAQVPDGLLVTRGDIWSHYPTPLGHVRLSIIKPHGTIALGDATAVTGTYGASVAWTTCRSSRCSLHLVNTTTGHTRILRPPAGYRGYAHGGAFSPDGSLLATFVPSKSRYGFNVIHLVVIRVRTGKVSVIGPGLFAGPAHLGAASWSADGHWLYFGGLDGTLDAEQVTAAGPQGRSWSLPLYTSFAVTGD